jgi:superoxide dismutase, Cu-Zn family
MKRNGLGTLVVALCYTSLTACMMSSGSTSTAKVSDKPATDGKAMPAANAAMDHVPADKTPVDHAAMMQGGPLAAIATLKGGPGSPNLSGTITFTPDGDRIHVVADLKGVDKAGMHGFHVHEKGVCEGDFSSAGGHFNPTGAQHACSPTDPLHAGDFGNIEVAADGTAHLDTYTSHLSLSGATSVIGKAVILHAGQDDCKTQPSGNSGARAACGVIRASSKDE